MNRLPKVSSDPNVNWRNNAIQFPRLLAEIAAIVPLSRKATIALCESMDISERELNELLDRAQDTWARIVRATPIVRAR